MRIGLTVATVGLLGGVGAVTAEPELVFSASDVPTLRERVKSGEHPVIWAEVLARANDYCTPGSRRYADPAQIDAPVEGARIQVLAHHFGRRLSEWGQALGFAYLITGEERFGVHGAKILATAAERLPASDPRVAKSFAGARGDIMRGFAVGLDWLPASGRGGPVWTSKGREHLILPMISLGTVMMASTTRLTRAAMLEVLHDDYIRTARAKGLREQSVIFVHGLRNALIPVVTNIGLQVGGLLGGSFLTETVFAWPGIGRLSVGAMLFRDYPLIQATMLMVVFFFVIVNLLVDLLYGVLDPRISYQ